LKTKIPVTNEKKNENEIIFSQISERLKKERKSLPLKHILLLF